MKKSLVLGFAALVGGVIALQINTWVNPSSPQFRVVDRTPATLASRTTLAVPTDFSAAAERLMPSVVSIDTISTSEGIWGPLRSADTGSGIVYSTDGYIITNAHVVGENPTGITVHLSDGRSFTGIVKGTDNIADLAIVKIEAKGLTPATFTSNRDLKVGQWVIAVGNPLGQDHTLSVGVVSSLGRDLATNRQGVLLGAIQTDAAINPGNSGGALANAQGEVVGINSAILSGNDRTSIGIGFAIPIDRAMPIIADLIKFGRARYGVLGFQIIQEPNALKYPRFRESYRIQYGEVPPESGEVITQVTAGSPAALAGVRAFDVITKLDDVEIKERLDFVKFMAGKRPGDKVRLTFWSQGKTQSKELTLVDVNEI